MNSETKYEFKGTMGPWQYQETKAGKHKASDKNGFSIATTPGYGKEDKYNALLISAAPLLLSALIDLVGTAELLWDEIKPIKDNEIMTATHPVIEEAKRAIEAALNLKTVEK